ncbi:MAG: hypothetical protein CMK06_14290 [Ponticaulis sp.]|nr:hypothetical protein [Ponticaulis sp.]|tara:strand:- start:13458 stop:13904 length:447 start_codon:yes stop_codon:yes gene_type:complete
MKLKLSHLVLATLMLAPSVVLESHAAGGNSAEPVDKAAARITGSEHYLAVTGLHAPIASSRGFDSMMAVDAGLEIEDAKARASISHQMPKVRDALRRGVHTFIAMSYEPGTVPDLNILGVRLQRAADEVFGKDVAKVTIAAALVHKYN